MQDDNQTKRRRRVLIISGAIIIVAIIVAIIISTMIGNRRIDNDIELVPDDQDDTTTVTLTPSGFFEFEFASRNEVARVIGSSNTDLLRDLLRDKVMADGGPGESGYTVTLDNGQVNPADPPQAWHYQFDVTVNDMFRYHVTVNADPEQPSPEFVITGIE
ncbi:hypothetical protein FWG95_00560 [Candidatus Saccharibacteria bacterium]|nr:hypothetical protein [Candidatus Saccharibacteria bacterium]